MPWFADYPTCAQHFYDWTALDGISFLEGNVTLYPPFTSPGNSAPATFPAQAVNGVFQFKIVGPLVCDEFV
ncbi:hypothetical protein GYMLUDRAFT_40139 [Collybiopsis luxurians FD-317 M1]|uniref:Uncharacterized protein n=1 Tax=Collybiopsis luxurians FD-317 M1 TaxID=944289 RepID=A0A0D0D3S3_9AGAR|nr:hypothetical protein GYMLUDRAFT_40139 [Collybiopsis luxurians FD-317 M1]